MSTNTLGRYHIIRELARSNDIVYEASDPAGKRIALKELLVPPNLVGQGRQERIQRFTREARAAARLNHTNIVRILDHGQVQGRYYIAMEFLEGQSLRDVLRQRGALPLQEALRIAAAVADGLEYAHKHGVVHRDVKPDNVHLEPDGRVVITDFGIARLTFEPTLTADGQIFGTPSYMSPEQVAGKGIDHRSDLFSLGVMLYEMVAGRKPFTGDSVITITYNIMNMEPPPVGSAPAGVDQIIRRAMAKDAGRRYGSAREMAEDIRQVAQGQQPRHALAMPPAAPASRGPSPPQRSAAPPPAAPRYGAPMPQPVFNAPPAGPAMGAPMRGARPMAGARPLPAPPRAIAPAAGVPAAGGNGAYAAPMPFPMPPPPQPRRRSSEGSNALWLLGWLGVAVVTALLILGVVWATVTSMDRFRESRGAVNAVSSWRAADRAFAAHKYEDALNGYLDAIKHTTGANQTAARHSAAVAAESLGEDLKGAAKLEDAEKRARQSISLNPDYANAHLLLAQVLVRQARLDEAAAAFHEASQAAQRTVTSGLAGEPDEARKLLPKIPDLEADAFYNEGESRRDTDPQFARQCYKQAMAVSPNSSYARNAQLRIAAIDAGSGVMGDGGASGAPVIPLPNVPNTGTVPPAGSTNLTPPPGWDNSYK